MAITTLSLKHFRCHQGLELTAHPKLNIIQGSNATGKTSILEALHILSHGKSFRTHRIEPLIKSGEAFYQIVANYTDNLNNPHILGVRRNKQELTARLDGQTVRQQTALAREIPLVTITPESSSLVTQGPTQRRQYLDHCLFHVKQNYIQCWKKYNRLLLQRNAALKKNVAPDVLRVFDKGFVEQGHQLHQFRESVFGDVIEPEIQGYIKKILPDERVDVMYSKGWSSDDLEEALLKSIDRDRRYQNTHNGPHRADIFLYKEKVPFTQQASSGQQKLLALVLKLAQVGAIAAESKKAVVLLIDDLAAELDMVNQELVLGEFLKQDVQVWLTALKADDLVKYQDQSKMICLTGCST